MSTPSNPPAEQLAAFAAGLRFVQIPDPVVRFTENLLVDWFGSTVGGQGARLQGRGSDLFPGQHAK